LRTVQTIASRLNGPTVLVPRVFPDERGFFAETYRREWHSMAGIPEETEFIQDNHSRSGRGVVRGMHFHIGAGVAKLVRCARGSVVDVLVDLRHGSPTYGEWEGFELSEANMHVLYVPIGFAHGFCVLSDVADLMYKQSAYYSPEVERGIAWDDPAVGIDWPLPRAQLQVSERDATAPRLAQVAGELPFHYAG